MSHLTTKFEHYYVPVLYSKMGTKIKEVGSYPDYDTAFAYGGEALVEAIKDSDYQYYYIVIEDRLEPIYE